MHPFFLLMGLGWLIFFFGLVLLAVWAIRAAMGRTPAAAAPPPLPPPPTTTPLDTLARRFAAGEITAEEYTKARDLLGGGPTPPAQT
jgi:uncharacterized membrane protein